MDNSIFLLPEIDLTEYKLGKIKFLTVKEIIKYGEDKIKELLLPFLYKLLDETNEPLLFEMLLLDSEMSGKMIKFLKIFYKTDHVEMICDENKNLKIMIISNEINNFILENPDKIENIQKDIVIIDKNNFQKISEVICTSFFIFKPKKEENEKRILQVKEENKEILEEYLRLQQQHEQEEQERKQKNDMNLHQIITIVSSQCLWNYDHVLNMSYYQLWNSYISDIQKDQYETYMQYKVSPKFEVKDSQKHWMNIVGKY